MANLGVIDADPSEPPSNKDVIRLANRLLTEFNIPTTIEYIEDICAALFVLLYENLFSDRLIGIIRHPVSKEDEIHNCQTVIDVLSSDIVRDSLSHIRGIDIVNGDITAISNLLDIFSYLLDYVANRIESDIGTDNEDVKSVTTADQELESSLRQHATLFSRDTRSLSSRFDMKNTKSDRAVTEKYGMMSPELDINENQSRGYERYLSRLRTFSPGLEDVTKKLSQEDIHIPPSPIRPDQSNSLLGQKTVDSTELESQFEKENNASPVPKVVFEEETSLNKRHEPSEDMKDGRRAEAVGGGVLSSATTSSVLGPATLHDLEPDDGVTPRDGRVPYLSFSMPPPKKTDEEKREGRLRATVGPVGSYSTQAAEQARIGGAEESRPVKDLSSSYNELRYLVEKTAAMTREALQASPVLGRVNRDLDLSDASDRPRPSIPSDSARLAKALNAQKMAREESPPRSTRQAKKVAFSSYTNEPNTRDRFPLEELSGNDYTKDDLCHKGQQKSPSKMSPEHSKKSLKMVNDTNAFARHLAYSRQPELGAAHLNLKTEDRAIKKKQEFLQRLYQEDLGEFSDDVRSMLTRDNKASKEREKQMLKSYGESKSSVGGAKKTRNTSRAVTCRKARVGSQGVRRSTASRRRSPGYERRDASPPLKLESEEDLLPLLLSEFPHLHLSDHTWHELCRKGLHQIEAITRVYQENQRKKSKAQIQLEEAAQRQELLSEIMRKELDHTKRMRDSKDQKTQQIQVKNKTHEKRVQSARARRYYNEYQVRARGKQLKRRTREEMVFRDLFKDAMKIQKERIKDIKEYASDQRKCQETRRQNEMESLENFYHDQFQMLAEKLAKERQDNALRDKAQQQMVDRIKKELRKKIESEICLYQDQMFRDADDAHFRQIDADRVKRQLHMARYAAQI